MKIFRFHTEAEFLRDPWFVVVAEDQQCAREMVRKYIRKIRANKERALALFDNYCTCVNESDVEPGVIFNS